MTNSITPRNPSTGFLFFTLSEKIQHIVYVTKKQKGGIKNGIH